MEITETTSLCFYECESTHYRSPSATAAVHERSVQSTSLQHPSSSVLESPVIHHSLGKFALAWSTANQSNHRNQQYSIVALTDDTGAIIERYSYTAYGEPAFFDGSGSLLSPQSSSLANRYTYTGREYDPIIRLYHYRARMYDSQLGRFLGRDPIGFGGGPNLYSFVLGMPLVLLDPGGTSSCKITFTGPSRNFYDFYEREDDIVIPGFLGSESTYSHNLLVNSQIVDKCPSLEFISEARSSAYEKFTNAFGYETNSLIETVRARVIGEARCIFDPDLGVCKLHLGLTPGRYREESSFGLLVQTTITAEAEIAAEDYNDIGTCATVIIRSTATYHAGWDIGLGPGSFRSQVGRQIESKLITRVCCVCAPCPVLPP